MLTVIAYDVGASRRRSKIAKLLSGFGSRIQYSVFECDLTSDRLAEIEERLATLIRPKVDRVHIYPVCGACLGKAVVLGRAYGAGTDEL